MRPLLLLAVMTGCATPAASASRERSPPEQQRQQPPLRDRRDPPRNLDQDMMPPGDDRQTLTPPPQPPKGDLGAVWNEEEVGGRGVWVRRGTTDVFDARWGNVTAELTITLQSGSVEIDRRNSSDGNDCRYLGHFSAEDRVGGSYTCKSGGPYLWHATVQKKVTTPSAPSLGRVWRVTESGVQGVWTRRGTSNTFDARWGSVTAQLTVSVNGNEVTLERRGSSDGNDCNYAGV